MGVQILDVKKFLQANYILEPKDYLKEGAVFLRGLIDWL